MTSLKTVPIGNVVETVRTWNPLRADPGDTFEYIDLSAIDQDEKRVTGSREVPCSEAPSRARQLVEAGDVLVSTVRPNLNGVARVPDKLDGATASTGFCVLRPSQNNLDSNFLFHWSKSPQFISDMVKKATGASYPAVSDKIICSSMIPLPPLPEQRRIAAILDQADALRAKRREALAQLDSLKQSIFIEMFGDPVTNPKNWPIVGIEEVCALIVDCVNRTAPVVDYKTPYKMIRTTNVKSGRVNLDEVRHVDESTFNRWNRRATPIRGDVLLTREAPVGEAGLLDSNDNVFLGQRLMLYRADTTRLLPEFLLFSFMNKFLENQFSKHGSGSTVKHLPLPACRSFKLLLPPVALQRKFSDCVTALSTLKSDNNLSLSELDSLFSSLQHRAFRGEL